MRKLFQQGLVVCSLVFCHVLFATPSLSQDETAKIRESMKEHLPELKIEEITASPLNGLYQIMSGPTILYMSKDGRYVFSGDIIDLTNDQNNITETARKKARLDGLKTLGEENMIVFSPKDPKYKVTIFTDVDCGYCRKLQTDMAEINAKGIAVRYLAFPRSGPKSPTFEKMVKIWCAKDKQQALSLAQQDKSFDSVACTTNNVQKEFEYGVRIGVAGTPTIIFEDGTLFPGYLPPEKLLEAVKQIREQTTGPKAA